MATQKRIYKVVEQAEDGAKATFVRAVSQAQAVAHVVSQRFSAAVAKVEDLAKHYTDHPGTKVQDAGEPE